MTDRREFSTVAPFKLLTALLAVACCGELPAQESLQQRIGRLVQPYVDSNIAEGITVGVLHQDQELVLGYGRLSKDDSRVPQGNTIYEIGSVSKVFTGVLLADAVNRGELKLAQPAVELLPKGVRMPKRGQQPITLRDLATHVSGLPRLPSNLNIADSRNPYAAYSAAELHAFLNQHKLRRAPGKKAEYSNLGMGLLGQLLADQAGTSYEQLLLQRLATPLKMSSTSITLSEAQQARLAPPHTADGTSASNWDIPTLAGAGAIRSTANDMLRFAKANLNPPAGPLGQAIQLAWKVHQKPITKSDLAMGLGWHLDRDGRTRWHNGQTGGYHSVLLVNRQLQSSVVVLTNTATGEVDQLAQHIMATVAGGNVEPRTFAETLRVAPEVMQRYVGKYELAPGIAFTVTRKEDKLLVGLTGQPAFRVYARSETEWFYKVVKATLTFHVDDRGKCNSLELFQNGVRQKATRVE